jgi:hypothetical protein
VKHRNTMQWNLVAAIPLVARLTESSRASNYLE